MLEKLKENWEIIKDKFKEEYDISSVSFNTWIQPLEVYQVRNDEVTVLAEGSNRFIIDYLTKRYQQLLQIAIEETIGFQCTVRFILPEDIEQNSTVNRRRKSASTPSQSTILNSNLNPRYTFDTFVVGANNKFAHAASLAVAESPAERYNPLFIYGGVGLGKTHLMHSIAHFILKHNPNAKVLYVTSEAFTTELIDAIRTKNSFTTSEFREKYRSIDVLLIDDIQFIIGKESTQEEFFHTFNYLYENNKQVVLSSDKPPKDFTTLEERLKSRFSVGLSVDISAPDYETRMAILRKKEELDGYNIDNEIIKYIATNIKSNIRELEGALTKLTAYSRLYNKEITLEVAEEALKDLISSNSQKPVTASLIIDVVAEHYGFKSADLISQRRNKEIAYPRQIVMYLCREMTDLSLQLIGKELGGRDHTTIRHGCEKISTDLKENPDLQSTIDVIRKKINPSI